MRKINKVIADLEQLNKKLNHFLDDNIKYKAEKYDELSENISKIDLKIKTVSRGYDSEGNPVIKIKYEAPFIELKIVDNDIVYNEVFKAINMSGLVSMQDMSRLSLILEQEKNKKM